VSSDNKIDCVRFWSFGSGHTAIPESYGVLGDEARAAKVGTVGTTTELYRLDVADRAIGICGMMWKKPRPRLKNAYITPAYRGRGYYARMLDFRLELARRRGCLEVEATCTRRSLPEMMRRGAVYVRHYKGLDVTSIRLFI
jgi:GNAT superfamily N-acetyltransferase